MVHLYSCMTKYCGSETLFTAKNNETVVFKILMATAKEWHLVAKT